jgi:glycosyltransferase involved in cell wall biosynthesis
MRILHVNHALALGGTEVMLLDLASGQKRLGHSVTICSMYGAGLLDEKAAEYGIPVVHLNSSHKLMSQIGKLTTYLREYPQDIIHSHWGVWLPAAIAGFLRKTPRVHTHHSNQQRRLFLEHRAASLLTTKVVVLTPEVDDYIKNWVGVPKRKIAVILNGIDGSRFAKVPDIEIEEIPSAATVVGMVARLSPPKDYSTFMRAAKLVLARFPDVHFVAAGDGPQRAQLEAERIQLGLENFHFLGNRLDVLSVFKRMTINVLATKNEGLSITLLEAMASGCVCVASDIPANRFALDGGNAGVLVPGLNPEAMAAAIERLLGDSELRDRFHQGAIERSKYFTAERMAKNYVKLYDEMTR